jgi:hypothetical protein
MANGIMQRFKGKVAAAIAYFQAGKSGAGFGPSGNIAIDTTPVSTSGTNVAQTLMTYALPANALDTIGRSIYVEAWGTFAGNAAPKSVNLKVGGMTMTTGTVTQSGGSWTVNGTIFKTGPNAQAGLFMGDAANVRLTCMATTDTSVDTSAITISVVATDASANPSGNITAAGLVAQYFQ